MQSRWTGAVVAIGVAFGAPSASAANINCDAFIDKLRISAADLGVDFTHALVVSRARSDTESFDITTRSEVGGEMSCRAGRLERFEARLALPANARSQSQFESFQTAALQAALGWEASKAKGVARAMFADAREYLKASRERGDVYVSGKIEQHEPGAVGLGMIVTDTDAAFILVGAER